VWTAGQVIGLIHDIPTCAELVHRIEAEAVETLSKATSLIVSEDELPGTETIAGKKVQDPSAGKSNAGEPGNSTVGKDQNNPGAEIWGVGKSKL
ncbi:hypothetical protein LTR16_009013, partial [Cryomyces antarcticus]